MKLSTLALTAALVVGGLADSGIAFADQARGQIAAGQRAHDIDRRHGGYRGDYGQDYGHRQRRHHGGRHDHYRHRHYGHRGHHYRPRYRHGHGHGYQDYDDPWYGIHLFFGNH